MYALQLLLQLRQLVVVGGKEGLGPQFFGVGGVFQHGAGNGHAVKGGGAASDLVQNQQTPGRGVGQNLRHLGHLHHKGGLAHGEVVGGADAGENAVHDADAGRLGGNKGADLGHEDDEGHLAHIGGLTRHIGAGDDGRAVGFPI